MKKEKFKVPAKIIIPFAELIQHYDLENTIIGVNQDCHIEVVVEFAPASKKAIRKLKRLIRSAG